VILRSVDWGRPPEAVFAALHERRGSFFLDSAQAAGGLGAYSFIGFEPFQSLQAKGREIALSGPAGIQRSLGDPLEALRQACSRVAPPPPGPLPFASGAVGYLSYELGRPAPRGGPAAGDELAIPDMEFGFYDRVLAFEVASGRAFVAVHAENGESDAAEAERLEADVRAALDRPRSVAPAVFSPAVQANLTRQEYLAAVNRIKEYLRAGDVYQVNLTQRFEAPYTGDPYSLYQRLRQYSPAPFAAYLNFGDFQVLSSSPERFLRRQGDRVETRPIKGTRPRGSHPDEDARIARELIASEKDRAELLMIVDLERNDLGRVCRPGSIRVEQLYHLESHPTVHHLIGNVSGTLRPECDTVDCLRAMFPGGSITGAPKVRAMQIIDELETRRRDLYTGAVGYLGFDGNCDLNLAIRTIVCRRGRAYYGAGGGIVADSDPAAEYEESLQKGRAMRAALTGA